MRANPHKIFGLALALLLAACGGSVEKSDCNDGIDNDGDDLIDDLDPGCEFNNNMTEAPDPAQCNDTLDNDGDGLVDSDDYGCDSPTDDTELDPTRPCNDMVDNDGDGQIDFPDDPGCTTPVDDDEYNPALCNNQLDDDSDGKIDYPFDPGCDSTDDNDETDEGMRACSDGVDNDGDMLVDFGQDPGCSSAADDDEFNTVVGACGPSIVITDITPTGEAMGTISGPAPNELTSPVCNGYGGEFAYTYSVTGGPTALVISTDHPETTLDTVVYMRTECRRGDTELGCNDDGPQPRVSNRGSFLVLPLVEVGSYYIIVDAFSPSSLGDFKLTVAEVNPLHSPCTSTAECAPGLICRSFMPGDPLTCEFHECGDSIDNDGDGDVDFPFDDGCTSALGDAELYTGPAPQCHNGLDDDGDTFVDYPDDPGCDFAADNVELDECYPGKPVDYLDPVSGVTGTTSGATGVTGGTCGGSDSPEVVYALTPLVALESITVDTDNATTGTFDTIVYVREGDCASGTEVGCNNDIGPFNTHSSVTWVPTVGETYFVFVDSQWGGVGPFHIDVSGVITGGGACDPAIPSYACEAGYACRETTPGAADWQCRIALCNDSVDNDGDGFTDYPFDPGCDTTSDDNEDFPNPIRECSDGVDNDADTFVDFPDDIGCTSAADNAEINDCVTGQPVTDHPGGTVMGDTTDAASLLSSPAVCDPGITTGTTPEEVWVFNNTRDLTFLRFSTEGSSFDTVLYIRYNDCATDGPDAYCNNDSGGSTSIVGITDPPPGYYYAIVDGNWSGVGTYNLTITGVLDVGAACVVADPNFVCTAGSSCGVSGTCEPTACFDGIDNDVPPDGDIDYPADPGCDSINDTDETDPAIPPACADGIDNDGDGDIDWPMDTSCGAASDDDESCLVFGTTPGGYVGCTDLVSATPQCEDITTTGTLACSGDDCLTTVTLPFTFTFFGTPQTTVGFVSNGKLGFPGTTTYSNTCTIENNTIAVYWDDLYPPSGGSLRYQTFGTAPNRRQVFQWNIPHISDPFGTGERYDFRAVLHEGTNDIEICYIDTTTMNTFTDNGLSATLGIRGVAAADVINYSCDTAAITAGTYMRYDAP